MLQDVKFVKVFFMLQDVEPLKFKPLNVKVVQKF